MTMLNPTKREIRTETRSSLVAVPLHMSWGEMISHVAKRHNIDESAIHRCEILRIDNNFWNVTIQYHYQPVFTTPNPEPPKEKEKEKKKEG